MILRKGRLQLEAYSAGLNFSQQEKRKLWCNILKKDNQTDVINFGGVLEILLPVFFLIDKTRVKDRLLSQIHGRIHGI